MVSLVSKAFAKLSGWIRFVLKRQTMSVLQLGHDAFARGDHDAALQHYRAAYDAGGAGRRVGRLRFASDLLGRHDDALDSFMRALAVDDQHTFAHHCKGTELLLRRQFREGWEQYQWYYSTTEFDNVRPSLPLWDGRQTGDRILLLSDQGLGDALQFLRYGSRLRECFQEVVFEGNSQLFRVVEANIRCVARVPPQGIREKFAEGYAARVLVLRTAVQPTGQVAACLRATASTSDDPSLPTRARRTWRTALSGRRVQSRHRLAGV